MVQGVSVSLVFFLIALSLSAVTQVNDEPWHSMAYHWRCMLFSSLCFTSACSALVHAILHAVQAGVQLEAPGLC